MARRNGSNSAVRQVAAIRRGTHMSLKTAWAKWRKTHRRRKGARKRSHR